MQQINMKKKKLKSGMSRVWMDFCNSVSPTGLNCRFSPYATAIFPAPSTVPVTLQVLNDIFFAFKKYFLYSYSLIFMMDKADIRVLILWKMKLSSERWGDFPGHTVNERCQKLSPWNSFFPADGGEKGHRRKNANMNTEWVTIHW